MKRGSILGTLIALFVVGFGLTASAELKDNPYQVIIDRNPFGLRPIPPPPVAVVETNPPAPPPPDIKLTGITTLLGEPRVMLQVENKQSKKAVFPTMSEGDIDTELGITIVKIDTENMKVRIKNGDAETTLDFKNNGVKPGAGIASAAAVPQPGINPGMNPNAIPVPGAAPGIGNAANSKGAIVAGGASTPTPGVNYANAAGAGNFPQRPLRDSSAIVGGGAGGMTYNPNAPTAPVPQPAMTREEAEARIELARQNLKAQQEAGQVPRISPNILPPTQLGRALATPPTAPSPSPIPRR